MHADTFEQMELPRDTPGAAVVDLLDEGSSIEIEQHEGKPLGIIPPLNMTVDVVDVKAFSGKDNTKPAYLKNGQVVTVPTFIEAGIKIVVRTSDWSYVERAS